MPTTDLDGSGDWAGWLQGLLQNQGASTPYGPGGAPGPYSGGPNGLMPGGQVLGYHGTTTGQPSMGYPAVGQAAGRPSIAPGMQQSAPVPGPLAASPGAQSAGNDGGFNNPYQAAAGANPPQGGPYVGGQGVTPTPMGQGGIGSDARFPIAGPLAAPNQPSQATGPMDPSIIARQRMAASPAATSTAPPAAAPNANQRFGTVQYQTPNSSASRAPIYTALNLGGGQQPAVNPNVPAANAQPVSSASAPNAPSNAPSNYGPLQQGNSIWDALRKAPWNYGPLQQGNIWSGSGGPGR
jgi:hypothetical protein